jgi:hypothetical protein
VESGKGREGEEGDKYYQKGKEGRPHKVRGEINLLHQKQNYKYHILYCLMIALLFYFYKCYIFLKCLDMAP